MADSEHTPLLPENRTDLEALIEAAIARLDAMDGDPDFEDGDDAEADQHEASAEPSPVHAYDCGPVFSRRRA